RHVRRPYPIRRSGRMQAIKQTTRALLRPFYRRFIRFLYEPAVTAVEQQSRTVNRSLRELRASVAAAEQQTGAVTESVRALQAAVTALEQRPTIDAVDLGEGRLLGPHPCFPFMILDGQDLIVTPQVITKCYEPGTTSALRRLVRPGMTVV